MKSSYRGLGSIDIPVSARSVLLVGRIKDNPTVRAMAQIKSSLAPEGEPITFELNMEIGFHFIGKYNISVDDLLNGMATTSKLERAEMLLKDKLSDGSTIRQTELKRLAETIHIKERTLKEAKKNLGKISKKENGKWFWRMPEEDCKNV